ncbi:nitronate monooxygenase family protein [Sphingosinicella sp. BN140058]|uniref:NAD(P)H-dependent flavin oxidoreductase n=1 Tax=Sphingosinicella sp. BN140058 TaxID=1892855 RepID=UPI0010106102|nr:nitronate monooxygenase [Sphingosinicella sp. BN140058]QAY79068.1 nitronate monooxygenase [Sphingosinicella sp. BN140058]
MNTPSPLLVQLGIQLPIIQAPMAGVSSPAMAAAVSAAGGLGSIAVGAVDAAAARSMIEAVRAQTSASFNLNLFCHVPARTDPDREDAWIARIRPEFQAYGAEPPASLSEIYRSFVEDDAMLRMLIETRPAVVSFHFGLPSPVAIAALRAAGIRMIATATSLAEARSIEAAGLDAIVAQGWEAGGHRGCFDPDAPDDKLGTVALTRLLVRASTLPVVAAGGIMDGARIAAMLAIGAAAAQLGTAFVSCDESLADAGYRAALSGAAAHHTVMTRVISGRPARCLANRFTALGEEIPNAAVPAYPIAYDLGKALHAAARKRGESGYGAQWAGQGAPLATPIDAASLVRRLVDEMKAAIG